MASDIWFGERFVLGEEGYKDRSRMISMFQKHGCVGYRTEKWVEW